MEQILLILFGWLLGLLSPVIIDKIKSAYNKKNYFNALFLELHDLQYRMAVLSFRLGQDYGDLNEKFVSEIKPIVENYQGNEPSKNIIKFLNTLTNSNENERNKLIVHMREKRGRSLSLKTYSPSLIESNINLLSTLPIELQSKIHEFKNHLNIYNQEAVAVNKYIEMSFDSSISNEDHDILINDLVKRYAFIQGVTKRVSDKISAILSSQI